MADASGARHLFLEGPFQLFLSLHGNAYRTRAPRRDSPFRSRAVRPPSAEARVDHDHVGPWLELFAKLLGRMPSAYHV